jgi:hypothetical protein
MSMKNSMTPSGIEPFVAQYFNHLATGGPPPPKINNLNEKNVIVCTQQILKYWAK